MKVATPAPWRRGARRPASVATVLYWSPARSRPPATTALHRSPITHTGRPHARSSVSQTASSFVLGARSSRIVQPPSRSGLARQLQPLHRLLALTIAARSRARLSPSSESSSVDFADPWLAADEHERAGTSPPPSTRSISGRPVENALRLLRDHLDSRSGVRRSLVRTTVPRGARDQPRLPASRRRRSPCKRPSGASTAVPHRSRRCWIGAVFAIGRARTPTSLRNLPSREDPSHHAVPGNSATSTSPSRRSVLGSG